MSRGLRRRPSAPRRTRNWFQRQGRNLAEGETDLGPVEVKRKHIVGAVVGMVVAGAIGMVLSTLARIVLGRSDCCCLTCLPVPLGAIAGALLIEPLQALRLPDRFPKIGGARLGVLGVIAFSVFLCVFACGFRGVAGAGVGVYEQGGIWATFEGIISEWSDYQELHHEYGDDQPKPTIPPVEEQDRLHCLWAWQSSLLAEDWCDPYFVKFEARRVECLELQEGGVVIPEDCEDVLPPPDGKGPPLPVEEPTEGE